MDSEKLASKIAEEQVKQKKKPKILIQVNIGNEVQKSGITKEKLDDFYKFCKDNNYAVANDANECLRDACKKIIEVTGKKYSNGRDIRRFFEGCIETQASRLTKIENKSKADLMMIKKKDVENTINNFS